VVTGTSFGVGGNSVVGAYPTTAASQAAQLATDKAAVTAQAANILNTATILTIAGTFDLAAVQAAQLVTDKAAVTAQAANILNTATILTIAGTFDLAADEAARYASGQLAQLLADRAAVTGAAGGISNTVTILTVAGTFDLAANTAAVQAAQLATDQAAVRAQAANILNTVTILTVTGTYSFAAAEAAPITLDEAKNWLRIDSDAEDLKIATMIGAATAYAGNYIGSSITSLTLNDLLKSGIMMLAGHWYEHPQAISDREVWEVPMGVTAILNQMRAVPNSPLKKSLF
jgi:uncharacterized phage protein (predicted DNA packaging)